MPTCPASQITARLYGPEAGHRDAALGKVTDWQHWPAKMAAIEDFLLDPAKAPTRCSLLIPNACPRTPAATCSCHVPCAGRHPKLLQYQAERAAANAAAAAAGPGPSGAVVEEEEEKTSGSPSALALARA